MKHSAEWCRGALEALDNQRHYSVANLRTHYRQQLAKAEACEAGEPGLDAQRKLGINPYWSGRADDSPRHEIEASQPSLAEQLAAAQAEAKQWRDKCRVTQAKLENMAIDCGQAEGLLKRFREEAAQLRQQAEAARLAEGAHE